MKTKNVSRKGVIGITLAAIMIASIFAMITPTSVAKYNPPPPPQLVNNSIRLYGDVRPQGNAPCIYDNWTEVFDPTVIPKDSATFNPAYFDMNWKDGAHSIKVDGADAREKVFLRMFYEPCGEYICHCCPDLSRKEHVYPTVNLEYTYMLMSTQFQPIHGEPGDCTRFAFPIAEIATQTGLGALENVQGSPARRWTVTLGKVCGNVPHAYGKTMDGTIQLQKGYTLQPTQTVQFLDHKLQFIGLQGDNAIVRILYAGNYLDDSARGWFVLEPNKRVWFDRHNNNYIDANHGPASGDAPIRTWYVEWSDDSFIIGKELRQGDTFYVNAVRYDVPAIEVLDTTGDKKADAFKFITLRTKLPKGSGFVMDESCVSSQDIDTITPVEAFPVLPPFNDKHDMIDDIDIPLWDSVCSSSPDKERDWTDQNPECAGKKLNTNSNDKIYDQGWIVYDPGERIIWNVNKTVIYYIYEDVEKRFSTNLLEKLAEWEDCPVYENWTKFDIQTLPDQYTEFILPEVPDYYTVSRKDGKAWPVELDGDYIITTSLIAPVATGDLYDHKEGLIPARDKEQRVAFDYDPLDGEDGTDIYVNYNAANNVNTVRVYGYGNLSAPAVYTHWEEPFNPTVIRKDSITFDPAILQYNETYSMSAQNEDCDLKEYFRLWYVPNFDFFGDHCVGNPWPAIITETTYMLIDAQDKKPWHGEAGNTWFAFPIVADHSKPQMGLDSFENPNMGYNSSMQNLVQLTYVDCSPSDFDNLGKTTNGTIRIEKTYIMEAGDTVQFLDHKLSFDGWKTGGSNSVTIWYCGNKDCFANAIRSNLTLSESITFFDRDQCDYSTSKHHNLNLRTWYAKFNIPVTVGTKKFAMITVGKELSRGDIFYVDGVRYEIPAIEVLDWDGNRANGAEKFKYITLRTPYPKCLEGKVWPRIDACADYECAPGVSSQYIECLPPCNPIPVLPPLNLEHEIVDDTDVVLWQPLKLLHKWPYGDPKGVPGVEYFPCAERYLTMQYPPAPWQKYFCVVPIDTDRDMCPLIPTDWQIWEGPYYPDTNLPCHGWQLCQCGIWMDKPCPGEFKTFDNEHWIANDVNERKFGWLPPLEVCWKSEDIEPRYSTNLLEILWENVTGTSLIKEWWTKYDIQTLPDEYTEFKLPVIPSIDLEAYVGDDYQQYFNPNINKYPGSYLITTSFFAPNAKGDLNLYQEYAILHDVSAGNTVASTNEIVVKLGDTRNRFAFTYNASDGTGIYINEDVVIPISPEGVDFTFVLDQGANYVSLPVTPSDDNPKAIFGPEVNVWGYNPTTGVWGPATKIEAGKGYYAYAPKPKMITVYGAPISLPTWNSIAAKSPTWTTGWNLVGPGFTAVEVPSSGVVIMKYSKALRDFIPIPPSEELEPGVGYWAYKS